MNLNQIDRQLAAVEKSIEWLRNIPATEQLDYRKKLIKIRRELNKIRYATSERCSTAAFGESQMGKSYLVSAILSSPDTPFSVTDGRRPYNFIKEINPSSPNSSIEATGVITRFTTRADQNIPNGFLKVQLLTVADIVLLLCEAYYNQVDYAHDSVFSTEEINQRISNIVPERPSVPSRLLSVDDILDIFDYLKNSPSISKQCSQLFNSELLSYLVTGLETLGDDQICTLVRLLWNNEPHISRLFDDMRSAYSRLNYSPTVYARFDAVLKRKGTLLDVARLDEMYTAHEGNDPEFEPYAEVRISPEGDSIKIEKSFLSSLIAELCFVLPAELSDSHPFLNDLDILDFPGARRPEQMKPAQLDELKNLSIVLRRGKVSYLFNKYSAAKRISTLLFCHNNNQSSESTMGSLLDTWVRDNIGQDPGKREAYMTRSLVAPLFIISTWFNKDLEYQDELPGDSYRLSGRWERRFDRVLKTEVLKSHDDQTHWFNNWSTSKPDFRNVYMLRDFNYSKNIYRGYDADSGTSESGDVIRNSKYPEFFNDLKRSFIENDFVQRHFDNPAQSWNLSAACANDGTQPIIENLNRIAPNVACAREEKFRADSTSVINEFRRLMETRYHPENGDEQLKLAKRQAGAACMQIDRLLGRDPYAFGRLIDSMMISEAQIYEIVHSQLLGEEQPIPMSGEEARIFMSSGLDSAVPRDENIERLCDYLGVDSEDECRDILSDEGIDLDVLLSQSRMVSDRARNLIEHIESLWHEKILAESCAALWADSIPAIGNIISTLWTTYRITDFRENMIGKVNDYLDSLDKESAIGIISDYLSMQFNAFTSCMGYDYLGDRKHALMANNKKMRLNIDEDILEKPADLRGVELFADLGKQKAMLASDTFGVSDRNFLTRFPQYRRLWRWQNQLRAAYAVACDLPDYDVEANSRLKDIISEI